MQCPAAVMLVDASGRTKHTNGILVLFLHHKLSCWREDEGGGRENTSASMHQQTDSEAGPSGELKIASDFQYFSEKFMPPARIHLILTSFLPFLASIIKDHAEASENEIKELAINFNNRKHKLNNREAVQDEVL